MNRERRRRLYNSFDPYNPLAPEDPFNVDIDKVAPGARGYVWAERLADRVTLSSRPAQVFFTGLTGSGKSTELRRMEALLESEKPRRLVALVDANEHVDLLGEIDVPDLLAALVHGAERAVLVAEGRDPDGALTDSYTARLWNWLKQTDIELGKGQLDIPAGPKLVAEMRSRPTLRQRLRRVLNAHINRFLDGVREELRRLDERAKAASFDGGLVLVFDSLEKLRGTSSTFTDVMASAERVFDPDAPWFDLPVPAVWTVPPSLVTTTRLTVDFLPMMKIRDRQTGARYEPGYDALHRIVGQRASADDLQDLLGAGYRAHLEVLFDASGGYVRDLLRMLQDLALVSGKVTREEVLRAVASLHDELMRIVPTRSYPWLAQVGTEHSIATRDDDEKRLADRLIANNVVLRYQNRAPWFDLHPAARSIEDVAELIERAGTSRAAAAEDATR